MRAARHRWVLAVDNDAVLAPDLLPKLRAALEERPDAMLAQPRSVRDDAPDVVHYDGGAFHYVGLLALRNFWAPLVTAEGAGVLETDALVAIAALLDKQRVLAVGGYDETFFYLAEDFDLALRLRQAGERLLLVEDAIARHKGGTRGLSFRGGSYPMSRARLFARNRWLLIAKDYALRTIVVALPGILVYEAVWLLFVTLQGHLGAHLSGKLDFFRGLSGTLRARRDVQARRRVPDRALLVGKPLSLSPSLVASGAARAAARALELVLAGWWGIARWLAG
jgi:GT2 family glycosyltransferase